MNIPHIAIDLALPPAKRWHQLLAFKDQARQLLDQYTTGLGSVEQLRDHLLSYRDAYLPAEYTTELAAVAHLLAVPEEVVLAVNLYYDLVKFIIGCTAFAPGQTRLRRYVGATSLCLDPAPTQEAIGEQTKYSNAVSLEGAGQRACTVPTSATKTVIRF
ncbi:hypothetical protein ccbrp13_29980 [Ktedonobacteria bacterium brp13]|nr:hypothetical protein ccbrp13_29980 [Ktedonobacteria bacterium brp13]